MSVVQDDITGLRVDGIVNAANRYLRGGGGVDGAIHLAAGDELLAECEAIGGCPTGEARITRGYRLPARHVIHAVGPRYGNGTAGEPELLRSCYTAALRLAEEHGLKSVAFPCIATGVFGYPPEDACAIAVETVGNWLATHALPERVVFCCYLPDDFDRYRQRLSRPAGPTG